MEEEKRETGTNSTVRWATISKTPPITRARRLFASRAVPGPGHASRVHNRENARDAARMRHRLEPETTLRHGGLLNPPLADPIFTSPEEGIAIVIISNSGWGQTQGAPRALCPATCRLAPLP